MVSVGSSPGRSAQKRCAALSLSPNIPSFNLTNKVIYINIFSLEDVLCADVFQSVDIIWISISSIKNLVM